MPSDASWPPLDGEPVATDQRGIARPQGAGCDIGALERARRRGFGARHSAER